MNSVLFVLLHSGTQLGHQEREELRIALTATQETAIIQLLLEVCLPQEDDRKVCVCCVAVVTVLSTRCLFPQCLSVCSGYLMSGFSADSSTEGPVLGVLLPPPGVHC